MVVVTAPCWTTLPAGSTPTVAGGASVGSADGVGLGLGLGVGVGVGVLVGDGVACSGLGVGVGVVAGSVGRPVPIQLVTVTAWPVGSGWLVGGGRFGGGGGLGARRFWTGGRGRVRGGRLGVRWARP